MRWKTRRKVGQSNFCKLLFFLCNLLENESAKRFQREIDQITQMALTISDVQEKKWEIRA